MPERSDLLAAIAGTIRGLSRRRKSLSPTPGSRGTLDQLVRTKPYRFQCCGSWTLSSSAPMYPGAGRNNCLRQSPGISLAISGGTPTILDIQQKGRSQADMLEIFLPIFAGAVRPRHWLPRHSGRRIHLLGRCHFHRQSCHRRSCPLGAAAGSGKGDFAYNDLRAVSRRPGTGLTKKQRPGNGGKR